MMVGFWGQHAWEWEPKWFFDPTGKVERPVDPVGCAACGDIKVLVSMTMGPFLRLNSFLEETGSI